MTHQQIPYEEMLRAAGHRVTRQRITILDAVCQGGGHSTLGQIYARLRQLDRSIDRSTLYRTLKLLVEVGIVVSGQTSAGEPVYEIATPRPHHHLICRRCGRQQQVDHSLLQPVLEHIGREHRFTVEADHLVLFGLCAACTEGRD